MSIVQNQIEAALQKTFSPSQLQVVNQSHLHTGHAGDDGSGESHFKIVIQSDVFDGRNKVECHRMIFETLGESLESLPHALSIKILNPAMDKQ